MEIETQQAYLFLHEGQFSSCEECAPRIGDYHYRLMPQEPYDLPLHHNCQCYWDETELEGLSETRWNELKVEQERMLAELAGVEAQILVCQTEIEACREAIARLEEARLETEAYAQLCQEVAQELEAEADRLEDEADYYEEQGTEEGRERAEELRQQADECRQEAERLREEAEQAEMRAQDLKADEEAREEQIAGLAAQVQSLGVRKIEIEDGAKELEAYLERPTLEQQAAAIAGPRLVW
jgi:chromosome segregation ATPase